MRPPGDQVRAKTHTHTHTHTHTQKASPFRAAAVERYARSGQAAVSVRRPAGRVLLVLWLSLLLALAGGAAWLIIAWRYLAA